MKRAYLFLADGFEEIEGLTVVDILRRGGAEVCTVSVSGSLTVMGGHDIAVQADALFTETDLSDASALILPGGKNGTENLRAHEGLRSALYAAKEAGTTIAAICAAPSLLAALGLLDGKRATCHPDFEGVMAGAALTGESAVVDDNIITGLGLGASFDFAFELVKILVGEEMVAQIKKAICYRY